MSDPSLAMARLPGNDAELNDAIELTCAHGAACGRVWITHHDVLSLCAVHVVEPPVGITQRPATSIPDFYPLTLDGDGSFWANRGLKTIKTVSDQTNLLEATTRSKTSNLQPPWRRAELPGALGATLASRGAGDAPRGVGKLCERRESGLVMIACPLRGT
jgi:hypothetical protein